MGQVLGFSQCQEYGSVASTPDSTPPCTDGGNEESELCSLQTARDWSEDEELEEEELQEELEEDEGLGSSPSLWGTPRQNSYELGFSYFAIAEAEAVGASRHRDRRRTPPRAGRALLLRADTLDALDPPDPDWDGQAFLGLEDSGEAGETRETRGGGETEGGPPPPPPPHASSPPPHPPRSPPDPSPRRPQPAVAMETISVKLLSCASPGGAAAAAPRGSRGPAQEHLASLQWFSALGLSEEQAVCFQEAGAGGRGTETQEGQQHTGTSMASKVMDLIYWKDTERSGMVLTGLVVVLLSLFQLSIITVVSTLSLAVVCFAIAVRVYYKTLHILNWADEEHPFKKYLEMDIGLNGEQAEHAVQKAIVMAISALDTLKKLVFVANLIDSLKFLVLLYLATFLGKIFNGLTVLIMGIIAIFSLPLFYQRRQEQVDSVIAKIQANVDNVKDIVRRILQGGGPTPDPTPGGAKPKTQ